MAVATKRVKRPGVLHAVRAHDAQFRGMLLDVKLSGCLARELISMLPIEAVFSAKLLLPTAVEKAYRLACESELGRRSTMAG